MSLRQLLILFVSLHKKALADMEGYIVEGERVTIEKYPHAAFLDITCSESWICGASILNQRFTLTAAHCVIDCTQTTHISVVVGHEHNDRGVILSANEFKTHEDYDETEMVADIALVKLKFPFMFGPKIQRVILMRNPPSDKVAYVSGWGMVNEAKQIIKKWLKHTNQTIWTREKCEQLLNVLPDGTICAGSKSGLDYASRGDSGSALVIQGNIQIGLVSYKQPDNSQSLTVYTNVSHYYNWITRSTRTMYCG